MAVLAAVAAPFVPTLPAEAGTNTSVTPSIPNTTTVVQVGQTNLPSSIRIANNNDSPNGGESNIVSQIFLTPSCGGGPLSQNPPCALADADPGVFTLSTTGLGRPGTVCGNLPFTITPQNDATGSYIVARSDALPVTLAPLSDPANNACIIDFSANVVKGPTKDARTDLDGFQTRINVWVPFVTSAGNNADSTGSQTDTVLRAPVTLTTQASTNQTDLQPGSTVFDAATVNGVAGSPVPTGTVTFTLVGPGPDAGCTAPVVGSPSTVAVGQPSASYVVNTPGAYNFVATYSGDVNYAPVIIPVGCGDPNEQFAVAQFPIILTTQASTNSPSVPPGTAVTDQANLTPPAGAPTPTGSITYTLVGPNPTAGCAGPVFGTSTVPAGAASAVFNPTVPGPYNFVATYSGDVNYAAITTPVGCGDAAEQFAVARQPVTLTTQASTNSATVAPGTVVTDLATITPPVGQPAPTGTVTYTLVGPNPDQACSTPVVGSSTVAAGAGSGDFTVTLPGLYNFVATYSGDANYTPISTPVGCGVAAEQFTVAQLPLGLSTQASTNSPSVAPGTSVTDLAAFTPPQGGPTPTGTVTYTLIGPNPNGGCTAPVFGTSTVPVGSPSAAYVVNQPGPYNFVATYSGDVNYAAITTPVGCGDPNEQFAVALQPLVLTTQASTNSVTVAPGTGVTDTATLTPPPGGPTPTGTVTYTLVGPNPDGACAGPAVGSPSTVAVGSPSAAFTVTAPGAYNFLATYSGDGFYAPITTPVGCGVPAERFTVAQLPLGLSTQASTNSPSVPPGSSVTDLATFTPPQGGPTPTGTVTYTLIGPNPNGGCTAPVFGTPSVAPVGSPSAAYVVSAPGIYNFVATYSGDLNYAPVTSPVGCGDPDEMFTVALQPLVLTTQASTNSATVAPGTAVTDTATLTPVAGAPAPTGTVTYTLVGPNPDAGCTAPTVGSPSTVPVGSSSTPYTVTATGAYNFVATYSGDSFYAPITTPVGCGVPAERFSVGQAPTTIVTHAAGPVTLTQPIRDTATLGGSVAAPPASGTITFQLFPPSDPDCLGQFIFESIVTVAGYGDYTSADYTPTAVGSYNWTASYSGDPNNAPATSACGAENETSVVTILPTIDVDKTATPATRPEPGGDFTFNVVVTNTSNEVLTITSLVDSIYGDLDDPTNPEVTNNTCVDAVGTVLAVSPGPGNTFPARSPGSSSVWPGTPETDVITVRAVNAAGVVVTDLDDAIVTLIDDPPQIQIVKDVTPLTRPEPGGAFTYNLLDHQPRHVRGGDDHLPHRRHLRQPRRPDQPARHQQHLSRRRRHVAGRRARDREHLHLLVYRPVHRQRR